MTNGAKSIPSSRHSSVVGEVHQRGVIRKHLLHCILPMLIDIRRYSSSEVVSGVGVEVVTMHLLGQQVRARWHERGPMLGVCSGFLSRILLPAAGGAAGGATAGGGGGGAGCSAAAAASSQGAASSEGAGGRSTLVARPFPSAMTGMKSAASLRDPASANMRAARCCLGTLISGRLRQFLQPQWCVILHAMSTALTCS